MAEICKMDTHLIEYGNNLMDGNINLLEWNSNLDFLIYGRYMFQGCSNLTSFIVDLSNLTDGDYMFWNCYSLTSFDGDLSSLESGYLMFSCTSLESFNRDLSSLTNGDSMFDSCTSLTSFSGNLSSLVTGADMFSCTSLESFSEDLSNLVDGNGMFYSAPLTSFSGNLSSLTSGEAMFYGCNLDADSVRNIALTINDEVTDNPTLTLGVDTSILTNTQTKNDFGVIIHKGWNLMTDESSSFDYTPWSSQKYSGCINVDDIEAVDFNYKTTDIVDGKWTEHLCDLEDGKQMFDECSNLTSFSGDLSSLTNGYYMFFYSSLESFSGDLSSLTNGYSMFHSTSLTSFSGDLSSLVDGTNMFFNSSLTSFSGDLSSLVKGGGMFFSTSLTSFSSDLSSLTNGYYMFDDCKLNTESIKCIADTIKDVTKLTNSSDTFGDVYKQIYIGIGNTTPTTEEQGYLNTIAAKGWTVYINGSSYTPTGVASVMTLDEDGNEMETPIPYYAKPIASDEEHAEYTDANGNYFNIVGAQFIYGDDLSTYGMFTCEEDAAFNMGLTKYNRPN